MNKIIGDYSIIDTIKKGRKTFFKVRCMKCNNEKTVYPPFSSISRTAESSSADNERFMTMAFIGDTY